jgi:hypothetical protein
MRLRTVLATILVAASLLVPVDTALARTTHEYVYPRDKVWNTSLRLVRIDLGCPLGERDADVGYFTFEYVDGTRRYPGSVELVPARVEGRDGVKVVVQIPAMPTYVERMVLDRLARKLVDDYGEAPAAPPAQRPAERPPAQREPAEPGARPDDSNDENPAESTPRERAPRRPESR